MRRPEASYFLPRPPLGAMWRSRAGRWIERALHRSRAASRPRVETEHLRRCTRHAVEMLQEHAHPSRRSRGAACAFANCLADAIDDAESERVLREHMVAEYEALVGRAVAFLCAICLERDRQVVFVPCMHLGCCCECAHRVRQCPTCRVTVRRCIRVFCA